MSTRTMTRRRLQRFKVGARVFYAFGKTKRSAQVIEDRGFIGKDGRQLLRIRITAPGISTPRIFEVPAEDLRLK